MTTRARPTTRRSTPPTAAAHPAVSERAPSFTLTDQAGKRVALSDFRGTWLVLFFYPKDASHSCTREAQDLSQLQVAASSGGIKVVGVNAADVQSHAKFAAKAELGCLLLSDVPDGQGTPQTCAAYGVWGRKSMYGREYEGIIRTTLLIDPKGIVRARWDSVKVPGHAAAVAAEHQRLVGEGPAPKRKQPVKTGRSKA